MPCNCDHLEPTQTERRVSKICCLLDEFEGKEFNQNHWDGMHPKVYSQTYDKYAGKYSERDLRVLLVKKIRDAEDFSKSNGLEKYSLEMQMWWRDYVHAMGQRRKDRKRKALQKKKRDEMKMKEKMVYCHKCSELGGASKAVYHLPPACN